jgi:hypothetical protein
MSVNEDPMPATVRPLREGYQPLNSENRGYQASQKTLDKGYQPVSAHPTGTVQPPQVGTTAVIPTASTNKNPVGAVSDKK